MEVIKSRSIVLVALVVVVMSLMAYFAVGGLDQGGIAVGSQALSPLRWANISGTNVNLSYVLNQSHPEGGAGSGLNMNATNMSVMWQLTINNSIMANVTIFNGSSQTNNATFNRTFDSTTVPDGIYNLTFIFYNMSAPGTANTNGGKLVNVSFNQTFIVVDNTAPNVTLYENQSNFANLTVASRNITLINFSVSDTIPGLAINTTRLRTIIVQFDNASANAFNVSVLTSAELGSNGTSPDGVLLSGAQSATIWSLHSENTTTSGDRLNLTHLHAGIHTLTIYVNDSANNSNNSVTETFTLNTPPNVTWVGMHHQLPVAGVKNMSLVGSRGSAISGPTFGQNFSVRNGTIIVFNVSVQNGSVYNSSLTLAAWANKYNESTVIFMFDNATGNDFNLTGTRVFGVGDIASGLRVYNASYNVSLLAEGNHTVTVFANDTMGNWNNTEKIVFMVDNTAPTLSITCDTGKTTGQTVSCTCTATDALSGVVDGPVFAGSSTATESTTASVAGSYTTSKCLATDDVGNAASVSTTFTVDAASNGGAGSGGSGGGSSIGSVGKYEKKVWTSINAGETATVTPKNNGMAVTKVEFKVANVVHGAWVKVATVKKTDLPSAAATKLTGKIADFIEITKNELSLKDNLLTDVVIDFKVEKTWLTDNSVSQNDVVLLRLVGDDWTELTATVSEEDDKYVRYAAGTPGFSYFAVAEKGAAEAAEVITIPTGDAGPTGAAAGDEAGDTAAEPTTPTDDAGRGAGTVILWVVVILAVLGLVYWFVKRRK